jgi:hypothetical protein
MLAVFRRLRKEAGGRGFRPLADLAFPLPRSLSRLRGRVGVGVPREDALVEWMVRFPHPPRSCERVDLPRKRER